MDKTHSILFNYYKKFTTKGGYKNYAISDVELNMTITTKEYEPEIATQNANLLYPGWNVINSDAYNKLIEWMKSPINETMLKLMTYYDNSQDTRLNKGQDELYIQFSDEYKLTCIAFFVEYKRLAKAFKEDLSNFHRHDYWRILHDFISKTACVEFLKRPTKDQKWRKNDYIIDNYGFKIIKEYMPFLYKDRNSLEEYNKELIEYYDLNPIESCKKLFNISGYNGGRNNYYYNKFTTKGGYKDYKIPDDEVKLIQKKLYQPELMAMQANDNYPGWEVINSDAYKNLIEYMKLDKHQLKLKLLTYYDNTQDSRLMDNGIYKIYIQYSDEYKLTCIAFLVEYNRLAKAFGVNLTDFHNHLYWKTLYDFIDKTACIGFLKRKSKDQNWRKGEDIIDSYGIELIKQYMPFLYANANTIQPNVADLMNYYFLNPIQTCKDIKKYQQNGGRINNYYNKLQKYKYRI